MHAATRDREPRSETYWPLRGSGNLGFLLFFFSLRASPRNGGSNNNVRCGVISFSCRRNGWPSPAIPVTLRGRCREIDGNVQWVHRTARLALLLAVQRRRWH